MTVSKQATKPSHPPVILTLAYLLEKLERHPGPIGSEQHRWVVARLSAALAEAAPSPELDAVLEAHPGATELYENLNYAHAGLCRHGLDAALSAERLARQAVDRARRGDRSRT